MFRSWLTPIAIAAFLTLSKSALAATPATIVVPNVVIAVPRVAGHESVPHGGALVPEPGAARRANGFSPLVTGSSSQAFPAGSPSVGQESALAAMVERRAARAESDERIEARAEQHDSRLQALDRERLGRTLEREEMAQDWWRSTFGL